MLNIMKITKLPSNILYVLWIKVGLNTITIKA